MWLHLKPLLLLGSDPTLPPEKVQKTKCAIERKKRERNRAKDEDRERARLKKGKSKPPHPSVLPDTDL